MRLLILILLVYLCYRVFKSWMVSHVRLRSGPSEPPRPVDDIMIQDPNCQVYLPKREAVHLKLNGKDLFFCSNTCRDAYIRRQQADTTDPQA